ALCPGTAGQSRARERPGSRDDDRLRAPRGVSYCLGMSLFGSQWGIVTTVAPTDPETGVATWSSVPSSVCSIGSIANPMFFSNLGESDADVTLPTTFPSTDTGKTSIISLSM